MALPSRILIIGATGHIGHHLASASIALHHPTFVLVRPAAATDPTKAKLIESFKAAGIVVLFGSLDDYNSLLEAIRKVDVVISAVGTEQLLNQLIIISAIKEVGTIKRFLPSEFGSDLDKYELSQTLKRAYEPKLRIRSALEKEAVPFTNIICNSFASFVLSGLGELPRKSPPTDKVVIYGDGTIKAACVTEEDIGIYTIKTVDDPRTLNKLVYFRLPSNVLSQNEMVDLWESKAGITLEKTFVSEEELLKQIEETPFPRSISLALRHAIFIKGSHCGYQIGSDGVEVSELYPEVQYTTASEYLDRFTGAISEVTETVR